MADDKSEKKPELKTVIQNQLKELATGITPDLKSFSGKVTECFDEGTIKGMSGLDKVYGDIISDACGGMLNTIKNTEFEKTFKDIFKGFNFEVDPKLGGDIVKSLRTSIDSKLDDLGVAGDGITRKLIDETLKNLPDVVSAGKELVVGLTKDFIGEEQGQKVSDFIDGLVGGIELAAGATQAAGYFLQWAQSTEATAIAQWLLNAAINANPIGIIITVIALVIAAFVALMLTNDDFREKVVEVWNKVVEVVSGVIDAIILFFTETVPAAFSAFVEFIGNFVEDVKLFLVNGWNAIITFFTTTIPQWISDIIAWINELPGKIGEILGTVLGKVVLWIQNTWNYLVTNVPIWISNVVQWFAELPGKIWTWLSNTIQNIITWGSDMLTNMKTAASDAINNTIVFFAQLPGKIWEWLLNTIAKMGEFATGMGNKATEAASNVVSNIINGIASLPGRLASMGHDIIMGLWNGISGMTSWLMQKVNEFVSGFIGGFKKALGIKSPSKVMEQIIGVNITRGIKVGIEDEEDDLLNQADTLSEDLVERLCGSNINLSRIGSALEMAVNTEISKIANTLTSSLPIRSDLLNSNQSEQYKAKEYKKFGEYMVDAFERAGFTFEVGSRDFARLVREVR